MTQQIIKEAAMLRSRLEIGSINVPELISFLEKISANELPKKKAKRSLSEIMERIERKHRAHLNIK